MGIIELFNSTCVGLLRKNEFPLNKFLEAPVGRRERKLGVVLMRSLSLSLLSGALVLLPAWSSAQAESACAVKSSSGQTIEKVGNGEIDYSRCMIRVFGNGAPPNNMGKGAGAVARARLMAERAATMDALRNILEVAKGVRVQGESTADELAFQNPTVRSKVQGSIRKWRVVNTKYFSDASVQVEVEVALKAVTGPLVAKAGTAAVNTKGKDVYTGLIVDARGTKLRPSAFLDLKDETGNVMYSVEHVDPVVMSSTGMNVAFVKTMKAAQEADGIKGAPLTIKALRAADKNNGLVLSADAAANLNNPDINTSFLRQARVIVVID
jgi:hypothetical protein